MRVFLPKARPAAAALFVSMFLVACGDDDDPAEIEFNEETATEFAEAGETALAGLIASVDANATISNALNTLGAGGGIAVPARLPMELGARLSAGSMLEARAARASFSAAVGPQLAPAGPVVPDELEGTTFEWDTATNAYVASERTGAPATGIRFIYYAVDPTSGEVVEPVSELGYLDLVDASTASTARLELDMVRSAGNVKLADYFVQASVVSNLETTTSTMAAEGFLTDGDERVDFDMSMVRAESETEASEDADIVIANEEEDAAITLDYEFDAAETTGQQEVGSFMIENGSDVAEIEYAFEGDDEGSSEEGALLFNGDEVVVFSGIDGEETEYTRPDGSALTEAEIEALGRMWFAYFFTVLFTYAILMPFLALLAL